MAEAIWPAVWRAWLRVRYGAGLDAETLEAAVRTCEALRAVWQPLLTDRPDNAELPFPNAMHADGEPDAPDGDPK
ncbi:MAG TPA: hypothetical protein VKB51_10160 [bacterium]|nr:hypothetical protein [bacterium]